LQPLGKEKPVGKKKGGGKVHLSLGKRTPALRGWKDARGGEKPAQEKRDDRVPSGGPLGSKEEKKNDILGLWSSLIFQRGGDPKAAPGRMSKDTLSRGRGDPNVSRKGETDPGRFQSHKCGTRWKAINRSQTTNRREGRPPRNTPADAKGRRTEAITVQSHRMTKTSRENGYKR